MLKSLTTLLLICLVSSEKLPNTYATMNELVCGSGVVPESCLSSAGKSRIPRSILSPITDMINYIKSFELSKHHPVAPVLKTITCEDKNLYINVVKAVISNTEKNKCNANKLVEQTCTDELSSTFLATKLCNGKNKCNLSVETDFGKICDCAPHKYLDISYTCVPKDQAKNAKKLRARRYIGIRYNLEEADDNNYGNNDNNYRNNRQNKPQNSRRRNRNGQYGQNKKNKNYQQESGMRKPYTKSDYKNLSLKKIE